MGRLEFPLLRADQIEAKVKKVVTNPKKPGVVILLYKTARVDMDMLDEHPDIGPANWQNDYREVKENMYCGIAVNCGGEWVWKWDCGVESRADGDGNEKKGEASDSFKRAGFRWGIGRELYTSPFIFVTDVEIENGKLKNPFERFRVAEINYDTNRRVSGIVIVNGRGKEVYKYGSINYGVQANEPAPRAMTSAPQRKNAPAPDMSAPVCEDCGMTVSSSVIGFSKLNFGGHIYCMTCQKQHKRVSGK